ncbi:galactose oxidase [Auriscalpium vulgare]|uniref:Galactose oxidase n=1 Tax=Auriscalpium vulgare TaxID=40419 RepID=A0ACB8S840_9AGAM|nr:galactose oxidase [Auriscalpium vulgare]
MRAAAHTFWICALFQHASAYSSPSRWGQGTALLNDALFVYGGKTDPYNEFQYSSAPWTNDLLYLPLGSAFDPTEPPWQYVGGAQNSSSLSQGPTLAWHTLSIFNTSYALVFGGNTGPNSDTTLMDRNDSAILLDVFNRVAPTFVSEVDGWAGEPQRRIRHSASSAQGRIWVVGGERADGSTNGFSDHFVFDPNGPSFTLLPATGAPPDIFGHASVVLFDGRLLVFGGFSQSQGELISFDTIWALDTTSGTLEWVLIEVDTSNLPSGRLSFAVVVLADGRVLIHGGTDPGFDTSYSDGWILDTSRNPMTWTSIPALSQLGPRRDHFAVCVGDQVVFGFGT